MTTINPEEIKVDCWPPYKPGGWSIYNPRGVKITHVNGAEVICTHLRSQHMNRDRAIRAMEVLLDES